MGEQVDWRAIGAALAAPFAPEAIQWRPATGKGGAGAKVRLVPYLDAATVADRLDEVCGIGGWSFELEPIVVDGGELKVARGRLAIFGVVRDGLGTATNWEPSKGCASDALKRAATLFGVGRYLAALPSVSCTLDAQGNVPEQMLGKLREGLRRRMAAA